MAGSRINTLSVYGRRASDWRGKAVGNVYGNGSSSDLMPKPDKTVGNVYNSSSSVLMPKPILVIVWTKFWSENWWLGDGTQSLRTCPELVGQCEFTRDHSRLKDSDVLVFHMNDKLNLPRRHLRHQKWVFSTVEPPPIVKRANLPALQGVFNLTMTYARSAQVSWTYGRYELLSPETKPDYDKTFNFAANKRHLVAWFVSRCKSWSSRETYVLVLGKHINVHQYGCEGKYNCPKKEASACDRRLKDNYTFYLAFENSICRDYVTEKFWRILHLNVVPIVLGNASYSDILPPHSYIDVRDFPSPRHLADYIKLLVPTTRCITSSSNGEPSTHVASSRNRATWHATCVDTRSRCAARRRSSRTWWPNGDRSKTASNRNNFIVAWKDTFELRFGQ